MLLDGDVQRRADAPKAVGRRYRLPDRATAALGLSVRAKRGSRKCSMFCFVRSIVRWV